MGRRGFEGRLRARGPRTYLGQEEGRGNSFGGQTKGGGVARVEGRQWRRRGQNKEEVPEET